MVDVPQANAVPTTGNKDYDRLLEKGGYFDKGASPSDKGLLEEVRKQTGVVAKVSRAVGGLSDSTGQDDGFGKAVIHIGQELKGNPESVIKAIKDTMRREHGHGDTVGILTPPETPKQLQELEALAVASDGGKHGRVR